MSLLNPILESWSQTVSESGTFSVLPDGCRDIIVVLRNNGGHEMFVSPIMIQPEQVSALRGDTFMGVRLKPGTRIDHGQLARMTHPCSLDSLETVALEVSTVSRELADILGCLSISGSPKSAASELGVSLRTLQRHTTRNTGHSPDFWRRLARVRNAARGVLNGLRPIDSALLCGYADQSHMTNDFRHWLHLTPGRLISARNDDDHPARQLLSPGYDAPVTGEQISIR